MHGHSQAQPFFYLFFKIYLFIFLRCTDQVDDI